MCTAVHRIVKKEYWQSAQKCKQSPANKWCDKCNAMQSKVNFFFLFLFICHLAISAAWQLHQCVSVHEIHKHIISSCCWMCAIHFCKHINRFAIQANLNTHKHTHILLLVAFCCYMSIRFWWPFARNSYIRRGAAPNATKIFSI